MTRIILLLLILLATINQLPIVAGGLFIFYLGYYTGYELVLVALLIDGYYGAFYSFPWLTVVVFWLFITVTVTKEKLLLYTQTDEILS